MIQLYIVLRSLNKDSDFLEYLLIIHYVLGILLETGDTLICQSNYFAA